MQLAVALKKPIDNPKVQTLCSAHIWENMHETHNGSEAVSTSSPNFPPTLPQPSGSQQQPCGDGDGVLAWEDSVTGILTESKFG